MWKPITEEAAVKYDRPLDIIEGPLMDGMKVVETYLERGKCFCPRSLRVPGH